MYIYDVTGWNKLVTSFEKNRVMSYTHAPLIEHFLFLSDQNPHMKCKFYLYTSKNFSIDSLVSMFNNNPEIISSHIEKYGTKYV